MILRLLVSAIYVFLLAPVVVVCVIAFSDAASMRVPPTQWSLRWFRSFFENELFVSALVTSFKVAIASSAVAVIVGLMAALAIKQLKSTPMRFLEVVYMSPLFIPNILIGVLLFLIFIPSNIQGTFLGLFLGHVLVTTPYAIRTILSSLHGLDPSMTEAARTMGASRMRALFEVTLPLIKTGLLAGVLFAFSVSFTDFYLALFLTSNQMMTLPMEIFYYLEWQQDPVVAAASTIQIALVILVGVAADRLGGLGRFAGR